MPVPLAEGQHPDQPRKVVTAAGPLALDCLLAVQLPRLETFTQASAPAMRSSGSEGD